MNETNQYIYDEIKSAVKSGFRTEEEVQEMINDILEEDADENMLRKLIIFEFDKKYEEQKLWPKITDVERLDKVFKTLKKAGVLCLHDAGYTMSDGHEDTNEELKEYPKDTFYGYCFYHGQDILRAISGLGLMLAYDHVKGDVEDKIKVANKLNNELKNAGFETQWDGTTNQRINIPSFDWKNRINK